MPAAHFDFTSRLHGPKGCAIAARVNQWTMDSPAPLQSKDGRYPVPLSGIVTGQEGPM